jgi:hypothetical protein
MRGAEAQVQWITQLYQAGIIPVAEFRARVDAVLASFASLESLLDGDRVRCGDFTLRVVPSWG